MRVKVMGVVYEVEEVGCVSRDGFLFGEVDHVAQKIRIDSSLRPDKRAETCLHEVLHCILQQLGDHEAHNDESFVTRIASALAQVLMDNSELLALFGFCLREGTSG
ncbi:MAG: hypothetical protein Q4A13_10835 [Fretibacterium sp.]|nr:hypothetical protein [Fretibacterium sp.]